MNHDEELGQQMAEARKRLGLSQAEVASRMSEAGVPMYPQTITKLEAGTRALKFREGVVLARVLGVPIEALASAPNDPQGLDRALLLARYSHAVQAACDAIGNATEDLLENQDALKGALGDYVDQASAESPWVKASKIDPADVVEEAKQHWAEFSAVARRWGGDGER